MELGYHHKDAKRNTEINEKNTLNVQTSVYTIASHSRTCSIHVSFQPPQDTAAYKCDSEAKNDNDVTRIKDEASVAVQKDARNLPLKIEKPTSQNSILDWFTGVSCHPLVNLFTSLNRRPLPFISFS